MANRKPRRSTTLAVLTATCAGLAGATSPAAAHPGHEPAPLPPDQSAFQKVTLNDRPGEPMSLAVLPTCGSCIPPAPASCGSTTRAPG